MGGRIKIRDINDPPSQPVSAGGGAGGSASGQDDPLPKFTGGQQGAIIYRGPIKWEILGPNTSGKVLTTKGPGANPNWQTLNVSGRASGIEIILTNPIRSSGQKKTATLDTPTFTTAVA